jgi:hypothetical protein
MTSQPQTIIIITSRESSSPAGASKRNRKTQGKKKIQSFSLQSSPLPTTTQTTSHLNFSKPHDKQHSNLHQQPNRPNQAQTNDQNAAPHHPPPPLNRKTQFPPYHHRHNNNPPFLPLPPQPSPQRLPRQRLPQARTNRILQIRQRRRRSRDRESSLRPFLDTPRGRAKHCWEGEWW